MLIDKRFCGPPNSANGGYFAGLAAAAVAGDAVVTLRLPPPLGEELTVVGERGSAAVKGSGSLIAEVETATIDSEVPRPVSYDAAVAAAGHEPYPDPAAHPFPTCFVCGPRSDRGLRIFPGSVPGRDVVAAAWMPDPSLVDGDGTVRPEFVWAALDCPSYFGARAADPEIPAATVLGRMAARIISLPRAGDRLSVVGWGSDRQGRKIAAGSAVFDVRGHLVAHARSTWISLT